MSSDAFFSRWSGLIDGSLRKSVRNPVVNQDGYYWFFLIFVSLFAIWLPLNIDTHASYFFILVFWGLSFSGLFAALYKKYGNSITVTEFSAFMSIIIGLTLAALETTVQPLTPESYPPLKYIYLFLCPFMTGILFWAAKSAWTTIEISWLLVLWSMSLIYTQPMDKYPVAVAYLIFPLLIGITALIKTSSPGPITVRSFLNPLSPAAAFLFAQVLWGWSHQSETFNTDILLFTSALLFILVTASVMSRNPFRCMEAVYYALTLNFILLTILALARYVWLIKPNAIQTLLAFKLWISLIHPNVVAAYLAASLPILLIASFRFSKGIRISALILIPILIMLTLSRNAWGVLLVGMVYLLAPYAIRKYHTHQESAFQKNMLRGFIISIVFIFLFLLKSIPYRVLSADSIRNRLEIWRLCLSGIFDKPVWGHGLSNHSVLAAKVLDPTNPQIEFLRKWMHWDRLGRHFHSVYLEILWLGGLVALAVILFLVVGIIKARTGSAKYRGQWDRNVKTGMMMLLLNGLFDCVFYYPGMMMLFSLLLGILWGSNRNNSLSEYSDLVRRKMPVAFFMLIMLFLILLIWMPFMGSHWEKRGDKNIPLKPQWAIPAYRKATLYRPWDVSILQKLLKAEAGVKRTAAIPDMLHRILKTQPRDIKALEILSWQTFKSTCALDGFTKAVRLDPSGVLSGEHFSDLGMAQCICGQDDAGEKSLITAYMMNPELCSQFIESFTRVKGGVILRSRKLREYLSKRFDFPDFSAVDIPATIIPVETALDRLEQELTRDDAGWKVHQERAALIKARYLKKDFEDVIRLTNRWNISLEELLGKENTKIQTFAPGSPEYAKIQAHRALRDGDYDRALADYREAVAGGVFDAEVFSGIGEIYIHRGNWSEALRMFLKAKSFEPDNTEIAANIGWIKMQMDARKEAITIFEKVLASNPYSLKSLFYLGILRLEQGRYQVAMNLFSRALKLKPDDPLILFNLGICMKHLPGKDEEYEKIMDKLASSSLTSNTPGELQAAVRDWRGKQSQ